MGKPPLSKLIAPAFRPVHTDVNRAAHAEYWLKGGRGSGKSSFVSLEIVTGLLRDPQANAIVYRKVAATLRESVYMQIAWAIDALGLACWFRSSLSPLEIKYQPTGQRILFRGAGDPAKSKSIKLLKGHFKYLWFEELTEFRGMEDIRTIKASVIRGGPAITFYTYNPPRSAQNWTNAEALIPRADRLVHHSDYTRMPPQWLGPSFLAEAEALRVANERAWRHTYLGEVTGCGGQVFDNLLLRTLAGEEMAGFDRLYCGLDHGFAVDPAALVVVHYDKGARTLYLIDEYCKVGASYDDIAAAARRALPPGAAITADSAEPRSNDELARRGLCVAGATKGPGSVEHGMRWLQDLAAIVIDPARCPCAAREFTRYAYEPDRNGGFKAAYPDRDNHTIDAVRYGLEPVIGRRVARIPNRMRLGI
ncbi:MAG: phage terminase large subunit [Clostridia bacterium]|nr:phage terminase large subunit [Clostridia bacterium]